MKIIFTTYFLLFCALIFAQNNLSYRAFGRIQIQTPDSLIIDYKNSENSIQKYNATLAIIGFHNNNFSVDSTLWYANNFDNHIKLSDPNWFSNNVNKTDYLQYIKAESYRKKGLLDKSLGLYIPIIRSTKKSGNDSLYWMSYLGFLQTKFARNDLAGIKSEYNKIISNATEEKTKQLAYNELGKVFLAENKLDSAKLNLKIAKDYFLSKKDTVEILKVDFLSALILEKSGDLDAAISALNDLKDLALVHKSFDIYIKAGLQMGKIFINQNKYDDAKRILSMVYANAVQWGDLNALKELTFELQNLYKITNDYQNAYALMTQYNRVSQEILSAQNQQEINELEIKYETAEKENEIIKQNNEIDRQKSIKWYLLMGFLAVLVPLLAFMYTYYQKLKTETELNKNLEKLNQEKIQTLEKENELKILKASIKGQETERNRIATELHDSVGGNLAALKLNLHNLNTNQLSHRIDETYEQVRSISHSLMPKNLDDDNFTVSIRKFMQYFDIEDKTKTKFIAYPEKDINLYTPAKIKVHIYQIVQELMTNAQKHANAKNIEIQLTWIDDLFTLIYEDDGVGFDSTATKNGIGLSNIKNRITQLDGQLIIDSRRNHGSVIDLQIPYKNHSDEI